MMGSRTSPRRMISLACAAAVTCMASVFAGLPPPAQKPPASTASATAAKSPAGGGRGASSAADFDRLIKEATAARQSERWEDAIALYAKAVRLKPQFVEAYWYQGTAYYTLEKYERAEDAFRAVLRLAPDNGAAYAFLGLCEFALKDYARSVSDLLRSRTLGVGDAPELASVS